MIRPTAFLSSCALAIGLACSSARGDGERPALNVPPNFAVVTLARIPASARELAVLPDGNLIVGTTGTDVYEVERAEGSAPARVRTFARVPDGPAAGVAYSEKRKTVYVATGQGVYAVPYRSDGAMAFPETPMLRVRTGDVAPNTDGDVHGTTSVAVNDASGTLYAGVGSSCNACVETDATRASVLEMPAGGGSVRKRATRIRNAIAMTIDAQSGDLWVGDAGQDSLPYGHPYEFLDDVSVHSGVADYGWPACEERRKPYESGARCDSTVTPLVELPAYATIAGAAFYPRSPAGPHAFPAEFRGALFASAHGSWHRARDGSYAVAPQVVWIPMNGDRPAIPVNWDDPNAQWHPFVTGFLRGGQRIGRPVGLAVGAQGSLFVADQTGAIYRIRPDDGE